MGSGGVSNFCASNVSLFRVFSIFWSALSKIFLQKENRLPVAPRWEGATESLGVPSKSDSK